MEDDSFECNEGDPDGVYVWSKPVYFDKTPLMLLKLRSRVCDEGTYLLIRRKLRLVLMSFTSVCCFLDKRDRIHETIEDFVVDYLKNWIKSL